MNLPKLLSELRADKRLLQDVIAALEIGSRSRAAQGTEKLMSEIQACQSGHGLFMMDRRHKSEMARLARRVRRSAGRRRAMARPPESEGSGAAKVIPFLPIRYGRPAA